MLATATPPDFGDPVLVDETLEAFDPAAIRSGDIVGIGIHTGNARRGYEIGAAARARGGYVVFGGIHATLYPDEAQERGAAHAVVTGDGDDVWPTVLRDCAAGAPCAVYQGGRVEGKRSCPAGGRSCRAVATCGPRSRRYAVARSLDGRAGE